jgi:hypothetical protein
MTDPPPPPAHRLSVRAGSAPELHFGAAYLLAYLLSRLQVRENRRPRSN